MIREIQEYASRDGKYAIIGRWADNLGPHGSPGHGWESFDVIIDGQKIARVGMWRNAVSLIRAARRKS